MEMDLLEKTEIRIDGIDTAGTDLTALAAVVAQILGLPSDKVLVIDVRPPQLALDILQRTMTAESFFGRKRALLTALAALPGVTLAPDADIHSAGILCAIGLDESEAGIALAASREMAQAIRNRRGARIRVFPTGFELIEKRILDTNTPYLVKLFSEAGFWAEAASPLPDALSPAAAALEDASRTYGLAVTTGGVGAEDKDFSVEAILALDPDAATPYLVHFSDQGHGRHAKDGIRIGVGIANDCLLVALPGPHDEVRLAAPVLLQGFREGWDKATLAEALARTLRAKFRGHAPHDHDHHHDHHGHHHHHADLGGGA